MEILKACLDEIGLSGLEGCTLEELWKLLSERQPPISFKLDEYIKPLAWKQLLKCAENSNAVQLYKLPAPREPKRNVFEVTVGSSLRWLEYKHPAPYRPINDATTGARGSCASFAMRVNVTSEVISKQLDLAGASESYGHSLVLVASQEVRERALVPLTKSPPDDISDIQYCLLEVVGCSRHYGTCRPYITNKYFKIDARSLYHHCKELKKHGLIVVKTERRSTPDNINRSQVTHVIYLTRFAPPTSSTPEMVSFEGHICNLLEEAPHQTLPLKILQEKLGKKKLKGAKAILARKGYVRSVVMGDVGEEFASDPELAKARGVQLIKPYQDSDGEGGDEGEEREEEEGEEEIDPVPLVGELPLISQAYRVIDSYGPSGITHQDFCMKRGLALDHYANRALAKALVKQSKVFAITSDNTNIRTVVLVSDKHVQSNSEYIRLQEEKAKSGDKTVEVAVISGENYQKEKPRVKKEKASTEEAGPSGTSEGAVPLINIQDYGLLLPRQQNEEEEEEEEGEGGQDNDENKSDIMEVGSVVSEADSASAIGNSVPDPESNLDSKVMTYNQLRRCNIIMGYMKQHRVVEGYVDLTKCLRDAEKKKVGSIDKKTVSKLLQRLEQTQRLCHRDDQLEAHFDDDSVVSVQPTVFWHVPDATEGEIRAAKEKAVQRFYCIVQRRNIKKKGKGKKKVRKKAKVESSSEEEEESESEDDDDDETEVDFFSKIQCSAKFQRLRHIHYYLWILAFGRDSIEEGSEPEREETDPHQARQDTDTAATKRREKEEVEQQKLDLILPETNYPWARAVHRLPRSSKGEGWLQFSEVHHYMPLSLWLIIINMYRGKAVGKLPGRYRKYFEDLELKNRLLHQLPRKLRKIIVHAGRDMTHICDFLKQLADMDLITLDGWDVKNKTTVSIHLNRSATILDTTTTQPRTSFFTNEARHLFRPIEFEFGSLADVERFWFKLQTICRQTPIILREHPLKRDADLSLKDSYPLLYSSKMKISKNKDAEYNEKGFGAGGLPPLTFSHLSRNWKTSGQHPRTLEDTTTARREIGPWASLGVGGASYMPGEGLLQLPSVSMEIDDDNDDVDVEVKGQDEPGSSANGRLSLGEAGGFVREEDVRGLPPAKRVKLMAGVSVVPSSQVKRNEGGRGKERFRAKKAGSRKTKSSDAPSSSVTPSLSSNYRYRFAQATAMYIVDAPDSEAPPPHHAHSQAPPSYIPERTRWFPEEDSFLLQSYLTSVVMKELGQPLVTYSMILDAFQREFPSSGYKNAVTLKRRLNTLVRKKVEVAANVDVFVSETIHMMNTHAEDCPEPTFESILKFIRKKYHSEGGSFSLTQIISLPQSLDKLHDNYKVVGRPEPKPSHLVPAESEQDIRRALLYNLILASVGSEQSSFDQYKAFKLFESFHEEDLEAVMNDLKSHYLIKLKRTTIGIPRHQGPNSTVSYTLSANFFSRLESQYFISHLRDVEEFKETFDSQLAPSSGDGHVTSDPAISLVDGGVIRVDGEMHTARNGTTAALVDTLMASKNLLDCSCEFPNPLFEPGNEEGGGGGGESEGEGEEGEGREDSSSQAARQLVKTAMKEAELERGANSDDDEDDEDPTMDFGEGGGASEELGGVGGASSAVGTGGLKYRGGLGITSLFNLGAGVLRHGAIDLTPGLSVAKLLDPLTVDSESMTEDSKGEISVQSSLENHPVLGLTCSSTAEESDSRHPSMSIENGGNPSSLEVYLVSVERELGFSDSDIQFAVVLHDVVSSSGKFGITKDSLKTHGSLSGLEHHLSIDQHIQTLINLEMIHCVGINEERLVSHSNSNFWSMTPDDVTKGETPFISYLPWSSVDSSDPNITMVTSYCHGVFNYIMANPGAPMDAIVEHFKAVLPPTGLQKVLNTLEMSGHIKKHSTVNCSKTCRLFDSPRATMVSCTYYEPVL